MHEDEITRLRHQLTREYEAGRWALSGLASGVAQHRFISARFKNMEVCYQRLAQLTGEEQATDVLCAIFDGNGASGTEGAERR